MPKNDRFSPDRLHEKIADFLNGQPGPMETAEVAKYVARHLQDRENYLQIWEENGRQPVYVLDRRKLADSAQCFRRAFASHLKDVRFFYAMKSNNHPDVARTVLGESFGLDVSSGMELQIAIGLGADRIVFSGPGKTDDELRLALRHADRVTVLMDSFGELERLDALSAARGRSIRAGVRLTPPLAGAWRKFGVPIHRLREFWHAAETAPFVRLEGIQFHVSWNMTPQSQIETITALGAELAAWPARLSRQVRFLDIGGGFWPARGEWLQEEATPEGRLDALLELGGSEERNRYLVEADPIERFAERLAKVLREHVFPTVECRVCLEPGRWICNDSMHLLMSVVDKKENDLVITDAGTNAIGWERFEHDYVPVINLTQPGLEERSCAVLGSLCTPHDIWGYGYWGEDIEFDDVLLIPDQGAYTYSLRQEFIKPIPRVVIGW